MTTAEILDKITPCNTEKPYIFISYSDRDRELVWQDVLTLQEYGYNIWLDQKNLDITKNSWKDDALNAISDIDCQLVVFYVSKNSLVSENCLKELRHTVNDETTDIHFGPVKFIAIDAQNIGNIVEFSAQLHKGVLNSSEEKICRQQKARTLSRFIKEFFNSNNERVRIHYKNEENRKSDYYTDIMASFPDNTKFCQPAPEKQMNEKASNTSQPDSKEIQYSDGIYKGEIVNGKRHGYGIYTWNNGDIYEGDWVDDKRHGHGKQSYHNGYTYIGEWKDDKRHGHGKKFDDSFDHHHVNVDDCYRYDDDDCYCYDGDWKDDKRHGHGKEASFGDYYSGDWKDDRQHGHGKMEYDYAHGCSTYEGDWKDGKRHGHGKMEYFDSGTYEGDWKDDKRHGHGKMTYSYGGGTYEGDWKDDKRHGHGKMEYDTDKIYEGDWKDDKRHGHGKLIFYDYDDYYDYDLEEWFIDGGDGYYDGEWQNDQKHGHGIFSEPNGNSYEGEWQNDKYCGNDDP